MLKRPTNFGYTASCPRGAVDVRVRHVDMSRRHRRSRRGKRVNIELIFIGKFQEISLFYSCEKKVLCLFPVLKEKVRKHVVVMVQDNS